MNKLLPLGKFHFILILMIFMTGCGEDIVEEVVDTFESGDKKVFVRFHPDVNVLEKFFYNPVGEMIHLERDSLSYSYDFQKFMAGTWIMQQMTIEGNVVFEQDSLFNPENPPNLYQFSKNQLTVSGPQYSADYKIAYRDSSQIELNGEWTYGIEGEDTYRSLRVYDDIDFFQILSYNSFLWMGFIEDAEKEEEVLFRRIILPIAEKPDTLNIPTD